MVQRAKSKMRAALSLITAFFLSYFYKAPEAGAQTQVQPPNNASTTVVDPSVSLKARYNPSTTPGTTVTSPSVGLKARYEAGGAPGVAPSSITWKVPQGSTPASYTWLVPPTKESDFQNWLGQQGITQLTAEETKDAAIIYRMDRILERLDQVERELNNR